MDEQVTLGVAVVALLLAIGALAATFVLSPSMEIEAGSIGETELQNDAVNSDKIVDKTIKDADVTDDGLSKIAEDAVGSEEVADDSIGSNHLKSEAISWSDVGNKPLEVVAAGLITYHDGTITIEQNYNIESVEWNQDSEFFEITLENISYYYTDYVTIATPLEPISVKTSSVSNNLVVELNDGTSDVAEGFNFVTYKIN